MGEDLVANADINRTERRVMYLITIFIAGVLLLLLSSMDLKIKKVNIWIVAGLGTVCVAGMFFNQNMRLFDVIGGLLTGLCAIGFSLISNEQLGMGDGIVIAFIGLLLGFRNVLVIVCMASFVMAAISIIVLALKKGNKHTRLPFIPALFVSYCVCMGTLV